MIKPASGLDLIKLKNSSDLSGVILFPGPEGYFLFNLLRIKKISVERFMGCRLDLHSGRCYTFCIPAGRDGKMRQLEGKPEGNSSRRVVFFYL